VRKTLTVLALLLAAGCSRPDAGGAPASAGAPAPAAPVLGPEAERALASWISPAQIASVEDGLKAAIYETTRAYFLVCPNGVRFRGSDSGGRTMAQAKTLSIQLQSAGVSQGDELNGVSERIYVTWVVDGVRVKAPPAAWSGWRPGGALTTLEFADRGGQWARTAGSNPTIPPLAASASEPSGEAPPAITCED
jgi:hypothetical protein